MRILPLIAAAGVLIAAPAIASVHQTSLAHAGETVSVSYEARTKTSLRQTGLGSRNGAAACLWKSEVSVERKLADAAGRPVGVMTRTVDAGTVSEGIAAGYCNQLRDWQTAPFGGNAQKMQAFLSGAADSDKHSLHAELASMGPLGRGVSR